MQGLARQTYWVGWVFLALAVIARAVTYAGFGERMADLGLLPRNFLQLAFLFFLISVATALNNRS
jgi:uncharacterized membrane protein YhaH (DUF805 family)